MSGWTSPGGSTGEPDGGSGPEQPPAPSGWGQPGQPPQAHAPTILPGGQPAYGQPAYGQPAPGQPGYGHQGPWGQPPGHQHMAPAPLRPGIVPLRPLNLSEIFDGAFQAARTNPAAMIGAAAVVVTLITAVQVTLQTVMSGTIIDLFPASGDPEALPEEEQLVESFGVLGGAGLLSQVVSLVGLAVLTAIATAVVGNAVLGRRTSGSALWQKVRGRLLPLIGLSLLVGVVTFAGAVVALLPGILTLLASEMLGVILLLLGLLGALAVALWLDTRLALAGPALVLENQKVLASVSRSWRLTSRGFWRLLGIRLLTFLVVALVIFAVAVPFEIIAMVFGNGGTDPFAALDPTLPQLIISGLGSAIGATILYPFAAAVTALLYIDQRMRLEGLDVELARAAGQP